jgi:uncharacterized membrane protein required for colicin V production
VDVYVLLDVLLVILIALFVPIGFWRGAYREAFVTLGILFGAALGRFWGEPWGVELAAVTRLHESGGAFMIAMLSLISATFLLGYSSGAAIPVPSPGWVARTLGALIAGANGALLLSFALRDIRVYLLSSEEAGFLDNAVIAPFLSDGTGWILLVAAAIFVPISLVLALFGPEVEEDEFFEDEEEFELYEDDSYPEPEPYAQRTMQIDQRRPGATGQPPPTRQAPRPTPAEETRPIQSVPPRDPGAEPGAETRPAPVPQPRVHYPQQQAQHQQQTPPPSPAQAAPQQQPEPRPEQSGEETHRPAGSIEETQPHRPQFGPQPPAEAPKPPATEGPVFGARSVAPPAQSPQDSEPQGVFGYRPTAEPPQTTTDAGSESETETGRHCPHCQADIGDASGYCPQCGERV